MPSVRQIRSRIRSVTNTARVTRAMQMVAASKMRRAQEQVVASRPYAEKLRSVLASLVAQGLDDTGELHPLLAKRPVNNLVLIQITPDRGLAGGLPSNINRSAGQFLISQDVGASVITVGRKGRDFMARARRELRASFVGLGDRPKVVDCRPITLIASELYQSGAVDAVHIAYTRFVNTLVQEPVIEQLLPIDVSNLTVTGPSDYVYEPDPKSVLSSLLPRFMETQVYQAILESNASEQSARMVAMRNATDAAEDMMDSLTLELNKARQATITAELLDLVGGVAALIG